MDARVAYHSGFLKRHASELAELHFNDSPAWVPIAEASLAIDDWGILQGATLVERLRTVNGQALDVEPHLDRLRAGAELLGIAWPPSLDANLVDRCVAKNQSAHGGQDFSIVILLTPGRSSTSIPAPTVIIHTTSIQWRTLAQWYCDGQPLIIADARNVPTACWPSSIKTRSRLHYYLADQQAHQQLGSPNSASAGSVLLSIDGYLTETSVANLIVVQNNGLICPPTDSVLQGISLARTVRLAESLGIAVDYQSITLEMALAAEGILLSGTTGCLWCAASLNQQSFANPTQLDIYQQLQAAWQRDIRLDYKAQAVSLSL